MIADSLYIAFGLQPDKQSIRNARGAISRFASDARQRIGQIATIGAAAVAAGAVAAGAALKEALDTADDAAKAARRVGVTTEALQELEYAAGLSGVAVEDLRNGVTKLSARVNDAAKGNKELVKTFRELNLDAKELDKLSPDQQFEKVAGALNNIDNQGKRTRLTMKLLEEMGPKFASMFAAGEEGIRAMREEAQRLGLIISDDQAQAAEKFNDRLSKIQQVGQAMIRQFFLRLLPELSMFLDAFKSFNDREGSEFVDLLSGSVRIGSKFIQTMAFIVKGMDRISNAIGDSREQLLVFAATFGTAMAIFMPQVTLFVGALVAALVILDDIRAWSEGNPSVLGQLVGEYDPDGEVAKAAAGIKDLFKGAQDETEDFFTFLLNAGSEFEKWKRDVSNIDLLGENAAQEWELYTIQATNLWNEMTDNLAEDFGELIDDITRKLEQFIGILKQPLDMARGVLGRVQGGASRLAQEVSSGATSQRLLTGASNVINNAGRSISQSISMPISVDVTGMTPEEATNVVRGGITTAWADIRDAYQGGED